MNDVKKMVLVPKCFVCENSQIEIDGSYLSSNDVYLWCSKLGYWFRPSRLLESSPVCDTIEIPLDLYLELTRKAARVVQEIKDLETSVTEFKRKPIWWHIKENLRYVYLTVKHDLQKSYRRGFVSFLLNILETIIAFPIYLICPLVYGFLRQNPTINALSIRRENLFNYWKTELQLEIVRAINKYMKNYYKMNRSD